MPKVHSLETLRGQNKNKVKHQLGITRGIKNCCFNYHFPPLTIYSDMLVIELDYRVGAILDRCILVIIAYNTWNKG